jgi:hypothetical protein
VTVSSRAASGAHEQAVTADVYAGDIATIHLAADTRSANEGPYAADLTGGAIDGDRSKFGALMPTIDRD